ncbi:MAG: type II toxin-antitoxin system PemK/MazF family toxin [Nanoarchaeota archaeon]|nr:type II toxin-antitoxin system PemK/MazF family toxin [Nanoarchaeota archaeon]
MFNQMDIVLMPFPFNDLKSSKIRPALVYSNSRLKNDRICLLITSKKPKFGIELTSDLLDVELPLQSWLKPSRIFTIDEARIIKCLSKGNRKLYDKIEVELGKIVGVEEILS